MEVAMMMFCRFGNQSSVSMWYELAYMQEKGKYNKKEETEEYGHLQALVCPVNGCISSEHSIKNSPWKKGNGNVVEELVDAAKARGIDVGCISLLGINMIRDMGPFMRFGLMEPKGSINILDAGSDVRRVGDESGFVGKTCWSTINHTSLRIGDGSILGYLNTGDPRGTDWVPPECDVSIRTGWFWHKSEEPKPLKNCLLLLNVPPNSTGLISHDDIRRLGEFRRAIDTIFSTNLAEGSISKASTLDEDHLWSYWAPIEKAHDEHWIEIMGTGKGFRFNVVRIQEAIGLGQRIKRHKIYADENQVATGTTIGYKRLHRLEKGTVQARRVRIRITKSRGWPLISSIGLHFDPYREPKVAKQNETVR
ncbi:hypothetical protein NE237_011532 [Protea cynaroides]|uniref:Uncharacterized protein n=1 Tax=Protea cynaroides TaxID=273540 RepID=A0A9Q0GW88_9MAGN|nr:hypothetical protein NE237_011532 [Protea cynaroides]